MTHTDDPRLPGLTSADTRWLVAEAQRVLTDLGHSSSLVDGIALTLDDGRTMGLDNLARTVSRMPRRRWTRAVRDQLATLVAVRADRPPATADLRVKLWPSERAHELLTYDALEPLPGVVAVLAAQGEGVSHEFGNLDLVGDRDEAYEAALTNVAALPRPRHTRRRIDPHTRNSWVEFLDSSDAYGAARVVVLPEVLRTVLRTGFPSHGVLVSVPTKFELWVHVPVDEDVVMTALRMSWLAFRTWAEEPYPVCPDVFLVSPDMHAVRLVRPDPEGCDLDEGAMLRLLRSLKDGPAEDRARKAS
ncbi:hypothetical protein [Nocardioides astragali]|uniref:Uncharacterized protein n=1 Tax=Nocardioides astragali TaxID=1776736 RepID=A0ABW2N4N4_9ACTN|nr:hypothetical protein [Nocardioides astragali]